MFVAIALFMLYIVMVYAIGRSTWTSKVQHEWFITLTGGIGFVYLFIASSWFAAAYLGPYAQAPDFPLWPFAVLGVAMSAAAIRSSVVYNRKYGITLAN
jgi:hypothetical protein